MIYLNNYTKQVYGLFILAMSFVCCAQTPSENEQEKQKTQQNNVLIVYVSRTNNTKTVAEIIHQEVKGTLQVLETRAPYPTDYQQMVDQVASENQRGYLPPLKNTHIDPKAYDIIFVGFPTWGMQLPPPMKSYLTQYDFTGKTIIPFNTNAGYGIGSTFDEIKQFCANSKILEGFSTEGGKEKDGRLFVMKDKKYADVQTAIQQWLINIGMR